MAEPHGPTPAPDSALAALPRTPPWPLLELLEKLPGPPRCVSVGEFELPTSRLRGAILEGFPLQRLKTWAYYGPTGRVAQKKG